MKKAGPKTIMCYVCGREFGTSSYSIHLDQCKKKYTDEQALLEKSMRKKIPDAPEGLEELLANKKPTSKELEEYNAIASDVYNRLSLSECHGCGRTFKPDSLKVHLKSCKGAKEDTASSSIGGGSSLGSDLKSGTKAKAGRKPSGSPSRGPKSLICFICGKGFMKGSISIHIPQCKDKFKKESENLGVKRKIPPQPKLLDELLEMETIPEGLLEEYNTEASAAYNNVGLMKCPNCSRTFNPDSLKVHMKSCNAKHGTDADPFQDPNKKKQSRPQGIMCYICGKEYFSKSIDIHLKSCKEAWLREENLKPKNKRRPLPEPPKNFDDILCGKVTQESKDAYNEEAFKEYNEKALEPCERCGRTFLPDRLVVHLRSCKGDSKRSPVKADAKKSSDAAEEDKVAAPEEKLKPKKIDKPKKTASPAGPPGIICYICGRKYGTKSIDIHIPQCEKAWLAEEEKKPKKDRRPVPQKPKSFDEVKVGGAGASKAMDEYNDEAFKNYNEHALEPCERCGRTFLPDRLVVHLRSCKGKK